MAKKLDENQLKRLLGKKLKRATTLERGAVDEEARTIEMSFSSDEAIEHWFGKLILNHAPAAIRLQRLRAGGPFLLDHDRTKLAGVHEHVETDGHKLRGTIRFSRSTLGEETFQDIKDGIRPNTSVGAILHELHLVREDDDGPVYETDDWEPIENSSVTCAADITVGAGVGRALDELTAADIEELLRAKDDDGEAAEEDERERRSEKCNECDGAGCDACNPTAREDEQERSQESGGERAAQPPITEARSTMEREEELRQLGEMLGEEELARDYIADETKTVKEFRAAAKAKRDAARQQTQTPTEEPETVASRNGGGNVQLARSTSRVQLKAFRGENGARQAHRFGNFIAAALHRHEDSLRFCREHGIQVRRAAHSEGDNESGGFLVPTEFEQSIIDLRLEYGVFRPNADVVPVSGARKERPKRKGGLKAYPIGAGKNNRRLTESKQDWGMVGLDPKKWGVLAKYEEELSEDWLIATGDNFASEAAYAFAQVEDECGFIGDGSSDYHGIVGVIPKLQGLSGTVGHIAGIVVASGATWGAITQADILKLVGRLPSFARKSGQVKWYCTNEFWATVLCRISLAMGGVTMAEIEGVMRKVFLGFPVEEVEVMPHTEAASQIPLVHGNLAQAASFGDRRGMTVKMTNSNGDDFEEDIEAYKATERFDINVHDVGNAHATAEKRKAGPLVALQTAAA